MVLIDILLSDIVMPRQNRFDFIRVVRENKYKTQGTAIFLTLSDNRRKS